MQIYGRRRRRRWWLCFCCWNSIILRGFTASQINCHYKKRVHSLNSVSVRAYNVQNRSNIGDNCVCDKWSSVQQPCPPQDTRPPPANILLLFSAAASDHRMCIIHVVWFYLAFSIFATTASTIQQPSSRGRKRWPDRKTEWNATASWSEQEAGGWNGGSISGSGSLVDKLKCGIECFDCET